MTDVLTEAIGVGQKRIRNEMSRLRNRLIKLKTLPPSQRGALWLTISLISCLGLQLFLNQINLPVIITGYSTRDATTFLPFPAFILTSIALIIGISYLGVAASMATFQLRFPYAVMIITILGWPIFSPLVKGIDPVLRIYQSLMVIIIAGLPLLQRPASSSLKPRRFIGAGLVIAVLCYMTLGIFIADQDITAKIANTDFDSLVYFIPFLLTIAILWNSTDFIEWGESAATGAGEWLIQSKRLWLFYGIVGLTALIILIDLLRRIPLLPLLPAAGVSLLFFGGVYGIARFARVGSHWGEQAPFLSLVVVACALLALDSRFLVAFDNVMIRFGAVGSAISPLYTLCICGIALALLISGLIVIDLARQHDQNERLVTGFIIATAGLWILALSIPNMANNLGIPVSTLVINLQPSLAAFKLVVTASVLLALIYLLLSRRLGPVYTEPFLAAFVMLVVFMIISWYFQLLLPALNAQYASSIAIAAVIFIIANIWDLLVSGGLGVNASSSIFPRNTRVYAHLGYSLLAAATYLYLTSRREAVTNTIIPFPISVTDIDGAYGLGLPLVGFAFVRRWFIWRHSDGEQVTGKQSDRVYTPFVLSGGVFLCIIFVALTVHRWLLP